MGEIRHAGIPTTEIRADVISGDVIHPLLANTATRASNVPGEALDFARVEAVEPTCLLRLRAGMTFPGWAWLQRKALPDGTGARLVPTVLFAPVLAGAAW